MLSFFKKISQENEKNKKEKSNVTSIKNDEQMIRQIILSKLKNGDYYRNHFNCFHFYINNKIHVSGIISLVNMYQHNLIINNSIYSSIDEFYSSF